MRTLSLLCQGGYPDMPDIFEDVFCHYRVRIKQQNIPREMTGCLDYWLQQSPYSPDWQS